MRTFFLRAGLASTIVLAASLSFAAIPWAPTYKAALATAKQTKKLLMVECYTTWDPWGKKLESDTFSDPAVEKVIRKFVPVRMEIENKEKAFGERYHVTNYPTVLFLDPHEKVVGIIDGFEQPEDFIKHANAFLKDYADFPMAVARAAKHPKDVAAVARVGEIYATRYDIAPALVKLKQAEALDPNNRSDKITLLYNAVGDYYQNASRFTTAIPYFQKAGNTSKSTDQRAYGYLSIVSCYFSMVQNEESAPQVKLGYLKTSIGLCEKTLKLPKLKAEDRKIANDYLTAARRAVDSAGGEDEN